MDEEERQEFIKLGDRMLKLYHKLPQSGSLRKIIGANCDKHPENMVMFFQGTKDDALAVQKFLNNRKRK